MRTRSVRFEPPEAAPSDRGTRAVVVPIRARTSKGPNDLLLHRAAHAGLEVVRLLEFERGLHVA